MGDEKLREKIRALEEELETQDKIIKSLSQTPMKIGIVSKVYSDTAEVIEGGSKYEVGYHPMFRGKLTKGQTVSLNLQTYAIVDIKGLQKEGTYSTVKEIMEDGRIKVDINGSPVIVETAIKGIKKGDGIILDERSGVLLENLGKQNNAFGLYEVPNVPWNKIGGLDSVIEKIIDTVETPFVHKELFLQYKQKAPKGVLLSGPPGCGKTLIAKAIAYNVAQRKIEKAMKEGGEMKNGHFISIKGPEILNKYVGESEGTIRQVFASAREKSAEKGEPVVVFIDEAEAVFKKRGSGISTDVYDSIVPQFLAEMDGMESNYDIILVLATNRPEALDPAVLRPGRIDRKLEIPRPNYEGTKQIYKIYLQGLPFSDTVKLASKKLFGSDENAVVEYLADKATEKLFSGGRVVSELVLYNGDAIPVRYSNLLSGAMIESSVQRAAEMAIKRDIANGQKPSGIELEDLIKAIDSEFTEYGATITQTIVDEDIRNIAGKQYGKVREVRPVMI